MLRGDRISSTRVIIINPILHLFTRPYKRNYYILLDILSWRVNQSLLYWSSGENVSSKDLVS